MVIQRNKHSPEEQWYGGLMSLSTLRGWEAFKSHLDRRWRTSPDPKSASLTGRINACAFGPTQRQTIYVFLVRA